MDIAHHTKWLPGHLLFEKFACVGLSQPQIVSLWFVSEIQGCQCLLPYSTSSFIYNHLSPSGEKILSQVYMHLNLITRNMCDIHMRKLSGARCSVACRRSTMK